MTKCRHYKGGDYQLLDIGEGEWNNVEYAVYKCLKTNKIWIRPLWEFKEKMTQINREELIDEDSIIN